jgi:hypothetical protein
MGKHSSYYVLDKGFDRDGLGSLLPGYCIEARTTFPTATYKGSHSEDEDFSHILQLAFERHACVISSDYAMIEKARRFHSLVVGHRGDRCMDGVIVLPAQLLSAQRALRDFRNGKPRVEIPGFEGEPFTVALSDVADSNLGLNLRAPNPTVGELCSCPWTA